MYSYIIAKELNKKATIPIESNIFTIDHDDWALLKDIHSNNIEQLASKPLGFIETMLYIFSDTQWYNKSKTFLDDEGSNQIIKNIGIKYLKKYWDHNNDNFEIGNYFLVNLYKYNCCGEKTDQIFPTQSINSNTLNPSFHIYFFIRKDNGLTGGDFKIMKLEKNSNGLSYHQKIDHVVKSGQAKGIIIGPGINYKLSDFEGNGDCDVVLLDIECESIE